MKIYNSNIRQQQKSIRPENFFELPTGLSTNINLLIVVHLLFFALYLFSGWKGLSGQYWSDGTLNGFVNYDLTDAYGLQNIKWQWFTSIFTYQFVHFTAGEFLLSISMLWLFGNMLRNKIGARRTILLYFAFVVLSAIVYNLSHLIFPIFSGRRGMMDGAFGGVLGIMTTTIFFYGKYQLRVNRNITLVLWKIYVVAILLSLIFVCKHNIAYIIVYLSSIYMGIKSAEFIKKSGQQVPVNKHQ
jgi:membrane associated rhomboid family serine protease